MVKTISNGKRGRNPLAPSEQLQQAFELLGLGDKPEVAELVTQVAELEDVYAEEIEANAQKERTRTQAKKALSKLSPSEIEELLATAQ